MKRSLKKCLGVFIIVFAILSICHTMSFAYSDVYPAYLDNENAIYIEVNNTPLGSGAIVLPFNCRENVITLTKSKCFFNLTNSTVNGYFISNRGVKTNIRGQYLSNFQYPVTTGYTTTYYDLTYGTILNTNVKFSMASTYQSQENNRMVLSDDAIVICSCILIFILCWLFCEILFLVHRRKTK